MNNLTDQEKSNLIFKLTNTPEPRNYVLTSSCSATFRYYDGYKPYPNLYDPENMAIAWRVLNWAFETDDRFDLDSEYWYKRPFGDRLFVWWSELPAIELPPEKAQRAWLDKILALALEAGMILR